MGPLTSGLPSISRADYDNITAKSPVAQNGPLPNPMPLNHGPEPVMCLSSPIGPQPYNSNGDGNNCPGNILRA